MLTWPEKWYCVDCVPNYKLYKIAQKWPIYNCVMYFSHSSKTFVLCVFHFQVIKDVSYKRRKIARFCNIFCKADRNNMFWSDSLWYISLENKQRLKAKMSISMCMKCLPPVIVLLLSKNFASPALLNCIIQLVVFTLTAQIPAFLTNRMSYVDIAWPWGLVSIGMYQSYLSISENMKVSISFFFQA